MALGLAGALVVILSGSGMQAPSDKLGGDAVVLLAIVASSFSMVWLKELIVRYKPVTLLRWIYPVAAVMMLPIGLGPLLRTDFSAMPAHVAWIVAELPPYLQPALREAHDQQHLFLFGARHRDGDFRGDAYGHAVVGPRAGLSGGIRRRSARRAFL